MVFDNLRINMISTIRKAPIHTIFYLNRVHEVEIEVEIVPVNIQNACEDGRGGVYGLMDHTLSRYVDRYKTDPQILAVDPAAMSSITIASI